MRAYPNINVNLYDGQFDTGFDCPQDECKFKFCEIMPPQPESTCFYNKYECQCHGARIKAIEAVIRRLKSELEELEGD